MPVLLGVDLGTTSITAVALDAHTGILLAHSSRPNLAEVTAPSDRARGYSEWDVSRIDETGLSCLRDITAQIAGMTSEMAGIGITGQQHGVVLHEQAGRTRNLLINWQDRRGEEPYRGSDQTYVEQALERAGADAPQRTGCRLAAGYLAVTLFWLKETNALARPLSACFLPDHFAALLTSCPAVTDPTSAASSGVFNVLSSDWDPALLEALGLSQSLFPNVRASGERLGGLAPGPAAALGLPTGLPVFVGMGDNQASFLGAVASRDDTVLVNVGTGGQVAAYTDRFAYDPFLETRPFPREGFLLVCAGLCGGRSYALLEHFFRAVGSQLLGVMSAEPLYEAMNRLAAEIPRGARGLCCAPFFTGSRVQPELRASWTGASAENFTPGHMTRALLEGMARTFQKSHEGIVRLSGRRQSRLVGAGNGLRENPLLARIVADEMRLPLMLPFHRAEAAYGAAVLAGVGAGIFPDLLSAGRLIRYEDPGAPS